MVLWDVGLVGVSKIMLARKLSSILPPPGVPLRRRLTGTDPGIARIPGRERRGWMTLCTCMYHVSVYMLGREGG